jgi:hypothetical protein
MNTYFGPLSKDSCIYFFILTVFFFSILVFALVADIFYIFKNYKELNFRVFSHGAILTFNFFIAYFVNRLLYTICSKTLA